jgi:hypothetical protein
MREGSERQKERDKYRERERDSKTNGEIDEDKTRIKL